MSKNFSESTEMRRLGLARLQYYAEDKCGDLRKLFETTRGLEKERTNECKTCRSKVSL